MLVSLQEMSEVLFHFIGTTSQIMTLIGRVGKNKRAARATWTYEDVRAILFKRTTWNYHIYRFDDNLNIQL